MTGDDLNWLSARTAIFVLRSIVPSANSMHFDEVVLLPIGESHSVVAATGILAEIKKPLRCTARSQHGVLYIDYELIATPTEGMFSHEQSSTDTTRMRKDVRNKVIIVSRHERLVIPAVAFTIFEQQFIIDMPHMIMERSLGIRDRLRRIGAILEPFPVVDKGHHIRPRASY